MPVQPYLVDGIVYDIDGTTALAGATVVLFNETLGEEIKANSTATTASDGTYTVNAADVPSQTYSVGDTILIEARKSGRIAQYRTIISGIGFENKDLTMQYTDPLYMIKDILSDNWQKSRTDNITPVFEIVKDSAIGVDAQGRDLVRIYALRTQFRANALGGASGYVRHALTVEVICGEPRTNSVVTANSHSTKMKEEVDRILTSKINTPLGGTKYNILDPYGGWIDLSDKGRNMGKWAYDMALEELSKTW